MDMQISLQSHQRKKKILRWGLGILSLTVLGANIWAWEQGSDWDGGTLQANSFKEQRTENTEQRDILQPVSVPAEIFDPLKQTQNIVKETQGDEISPYPPEMSVAGFANMKLEGKDFQTVRVMSENEWYTQYQIQYLSNGINISGTLIVRKDIPKTPLVVLNHGYYPKDEYRVGRGLRREMDFLGLAGYAVFQSDYRGYGLSDPDPDDRLLYDSSLGYAMDVVNGIEALKNSFFSPQIDFDQIGMLGHSMGGEIALDIMTAYPELIKGTVLYAPANGDAWQNFNRWKEEDFSPAFIKNTLDTWGNYTENPTHWEQLSSSTYLKNIRTPIWVFHGEQDEVVPVEWSDSLVKDLEALGKEVVYTIYPTEDHQFEQNYWDFIWEARRFLDEKLKKS